LTPENTKKVTETVTKQENNQQTNQNGQKDNQPNRQQQSKLRPNQNQKKQTGVTQGNQPAAKKGAQQSNQSIGQKQPGKPVRKPMKSAQPLAAQKPADELLSNAEASKELLSGSVVTNTSFPLETRKLDRQDEFKAITQNRRPKKKSHAVVEITKMNPVKITFLGGLNEIGKNFTLIEYEDDIIIVDCGLAFPDDEMPGVDIVLPDFSHLFKVKDKIRGIVLTHAHEDHIGALPYLLKQMNIPIHGTKLTLGIVGGKLKEHGLTRTAKLNVVSPGSKISFGKISVEFIRVNHSIPDACSLAIDTPAGVVMMTGDFKIDTTPIHGEMIDIGRFSEYGKKGVLALLSDSTNAERPGYTMSERKVGDSFELLFKRAENHRIIIATFSSNIHRVQQIVDAAIKYDRKIAVSGRSMINVVSIAIELGYLNVPKDILIDLNVINQYPKDKVVLITTGSQGEPMSALTRMAFSDHRKVAVGPEDFIIISATPIPGNEKTVTKVINELMKLGCEVVYEAMYEVHVSGHACQEELKLMMGITKPQFFIPVHGEFKHLKKHAMLARSMGISPENIMIADNGKTVEISRNGIRIAGTVTAGQVLVDGLGVGDVGSIVLRDRKHLAQDGLIVAVVAIDAQNGYIVNGPDIVSRGFVYVRESEKMIEECRECVRRVIEQTPITGSISKDGNGLKTKIKDALSRHLYEKTKRSPMILPVILEV